MAKLREATRGGLPGLGEVWWSVGAGRGACPTELRREGSPGLGLAKGVQALASGALGMGDSQGVQGGVGGRCPSLGTRSPSRRCSPPPRHICDRSITQRRGGERGCSGNRAWIPVCCQPASSLDKDLELSELLLLTRKVRGRWTRGPQGLWSQLWLWLVLMLPVWSRRDPHSTFEA